MNTSLSVEVVKNLHFLKLIIFNIQILHVFVNEILPGQPGPRCVGALLPTPMVIVMPNRPGIRLFQRHFVNITKLVRCRRAHSPDFLLGAVFDHEVYEDGPQVGAFGVAG